MKKIKNFQFVTSAFAIAFVVLALVSCMTKKEINTIGGVVAEDLRDAYIAEVDEWAAEYPDTLDNNSFCGYFLYDINADSIPELWLMGGTCEADRKLAVYDYNDGGAAPIYESPASHVVLYQGDRYIVSLGMNGGEALKMKLMASGDSISVDTLFLGSVDDESGYSDPVEPMVNIVPYSDKQPIELLLEDLK